MSKLSITFADGGVAVHEILARPVVERVRPNLPKPTTVENLTRSSLRPAAPRSRTSKVARSSLRASLRTGRLQGRRTMMTLNDGGQALLEMVWSDVRGALCATWRIVGGKRNRRAA